MATTRGAILGFVYDTQPTTAEFFKDAVVGNDLADHEWCANSGCNGMDHKKPKSTGAAEEMLVR